MTAVTLTSILIDQASRRNRICANCGDAHWTWRCPEIGDALTLAQPLYPACEMARLWWRDHRAFIERLSGLTPAQLIVQAEAHVAWLQCFRGSVITAERLLDAWQRLIAKHAFKEAA